MLEALGVACFGVDGYEADDVIGTLAIRDAGPVDVVTGDRDLFQLVDDSRAVRVLYTARGVGRADVVDEAWVTAKYGIPGRAYADFATLRGDPSDGLPGVAGRRRQDGGRADHEVRLARRRCSAALDAGDTAMPAGARSQAGRGAGLPGGGAEGRRGGRRRAAAGVRRRRSPPRRATRTGWSSCRSGGGWTARSTGCCRRSPACSRRTERRSQVPMPRAASSSDRLAA